MKRIMHKGQRYRCQNPRCRAEIEILKDSSEGESNPRCCCGAEMKSLYTKPVLRTLDKDSAVLANLFERGT
jgi:hypothetical protein